MNSDNYNDVPSEEIERLEAQRRRKAENFHLNIQEDYEEYENYEPDEINSYSGQDVKEQIARESKQALRQREKAQKKELKKKNKRNRRIFRFIWITSVVIVGVMLSAFVITGMNDMLAINRNDSETVKVEIPENPTIDGIAQILAEDNVIDEPFYFKWFTKITESEGEFTQGTYEMRKNMDYKAITNYLLSTNNRTDTVKVVIPEGQNVLEIAQILKDNGVLSSTDKFVELCNSDEFDDDFDFIESITNADDRYYKLEGYLYPDTYEFYKNEEPKSCIYKFLNNFETKITEKQSVSGYKNLTTVQKMIDDGMTEYSLDEVMIVASIIQAEAADVNDMYIISSILHNRLNADSSMGVSKLGLDSTKYYPYRTAENVPDSLGDYTSDYDTYNNSGLPAGPICNPGMDAILAAINPSSTNYYFFCHDKNGNAYYASTIYEHNANLEKYVND